MSKTSTPHIFADMEPTKKKKQEALNRLQSTKDPAEASEMAAFLLNDLAEAWDSQGQFLEKEPSHGGYRLGASHLAGTLAQYGHATLKALNEKPPASSKADQFAGRTTGQACRMAAEYSREIAERLEEATWSLESGDEYVDEDDVANEIYMCAEEMLNVGFAVRKTLESA